VNPQDGTTWVFVSNDNGISGLQLTLGPGGVPQLTPRWQNPTGGGSPLVANGVLYFIHGYISGQTPGLVIGLNPTNGNQLWIAPNPNGYQVHWESPIVANGVVYFSVEQFAFIAYALP
jgi:outer membrane protein assembly factor BamB